MAPGGDELEAGRYTPTMKLDFGGSRKLLLNIVA
jgi:hypothetical protein